MGYTPYCLRKMTSYTPIFSKIVDSSLWHEPDYVVKVFLTMLAKKDFDNIVRGTAFNIGKWACKTEAETLDALKVLSSPDTRRLEPQPFDGRRIEKVAEGWLILNGEHYQKMMTTMNRRAYKTQKQAEYRGRDGAQEPPVPAKKRFTKPTELEIREFVKKNNLPESDAIWFFNKCEANDWTNGGHPIKSWQATIKAWSAAGYMPSQKNGSQISAPTKKLTDQELLRQAQS